MLITLPEKSHNGVQRGTFQYRVVTKISSCRVKTTSRQRIRHLGISFVSIFLLFSKESSWGHNYCSQGKYLAPGSSLYNSPAIPVRCRILVKSNYCNQKIILLDQDSTTCWRFRLIFSIPLLVPRL